METTMKRENIRKKEFKQGIDRDISRRKREDSQCQIRKKKREDNMTKRRKNLIPQTPNNSPIPVQNIDKEEIISAINSNDPNRTLGAITFLRKKISVNHNPPIDYVVKLNIIPKLIEIITYTKYPDHQYESLWLLTNIVSGTSDQVKIVVEGTNILKHLIALTKSNHYKIREQAIWCIGNICAEDDKKYQHTILDLGGLELILKNIKYWMSKKDKKRVKICVWTVCSLVKKIDFKISSKILLVLKELLFSNINDKDLLYDVVKGLTYVSRECPDDQINKFCNMFVCEKFMKFLNNKDISHNVLKVLGHIIMGPDEATQKILDNDFLLYVPNFLINKNSDIRREICWIISNITAGNKSQLKAIKNSGFICQIIRMTFDDCYNVKKECSYIICNIIVDSKSSDVDDMVDLGAIEALCNCLYVLSGKPLFNIVEAIYHVVKMKKYYNEIDEAGGFEKIEELQNHNNKKLANISSVITNIWDKFSYHRNISNC